jgi:hypothetical protein
MISAFPFRYIIVQLSLVATVILERKLLLIKDAGLVPIYINANSGQFRQYSAVTLGARGDSYYGRIFVFFFSCCFLMLSTSFADLGSFRPRKAAVAAWRTYHLVTFYPNLATHHSNLAIHHPNSATHHSNFAIHRPNSAIHHPNAATHHSNFAIHHPNLAIHHP